MHRLTRRAFVRVLIRLAIAVVVIAILASAVGVWFFRRARQSNIGKVKFVNPLAILPLIEASTDERGRKVFELEFIAGQSELVPGKRTNTWGLNRSYLGPTLRASRGDEVVINVKNGVDEPTTLHWHGMHLPAVMDGGPHQLIDPGETWSPTWTIDQPAATLWYHPHPHGVTAEQVYRGAAGLFLLDDEESNKAPLPSTYGVDDIPLIVQDKRIDSDGSLEDGPFFSGVGILGDTILVNGTYGPVFDATTELVRFRILNASNARVFNLGFTDNRTFSLVGSDGGLLDAPVSLTRLPVSPAERVEIIVEMTPGDDATIRSFPPNLGLGFISDRLTGGDDSFNLLRIRGAAQLAESSPLPDTLVTIDRPEENDADRTRTFELNGSSRINGLKVDMSRIDVAVTVDTTEIWEVRNSSNTYHNFHIHDIHFAVLEIDGEEPPSHLRGWKDTVFLPHNASARLIARFKDYPDPNAPYMYHCHILRHEDRGMMSQFVIIEPGAEVPTRISDSHDEYHSSDG
jgi:blue copper oxidase